MESYIYPQVHKWATSCTHRVSGYGCRYILPIPPTRGYRIPNGPPGPSPKWPDTMRPDGFFVPGRVGRRADLAAQARP
jgi:hypothetical protein